MTALQLQSISNLFKLLHIEGDRQFTMTLTRCLCNSALAWADFKSLHIFLYCFRFVHISRTVMRIQVVWITAVKKTMLCVCTLYSVLYWVNGNGFHVDITLSLIHFFGIKLGCPPLFQRRVVGWLSFHHKMYFLTMLIWCGCYSFLIWMCLPQVTQLKLTVLFCCLGKEPYQLRALFN